MEMTDFIDALENEFAQRADAKIAKGQKAYMRDQFEFFGIPSPVRKKIQKPFLDKKYLPEKRELSVIIPALWKKATERISTFCPRICLYVHPSNGGRRHQLI